MWEEVRKERREASLVSMEQLDEGSWLLLGLKKTQAVEKKQMWGLEIVLFGQTGDVH